MIDKVKIGSFQFFSLILISRMFSMFAFRPKNIEISTSLAAIAIIISSVITYFLFLPALILIRKNKGRSVLDSASLASDGIYKLFYTTVLISSLLVSAETLSQFEFFMTSTIYLNIGPIFFVIAMLASAAFICLLGIEAMARLSEFVFSGLIISIIVIIIFSLPYVNLIYLEPIKSGEIKSFFELILDNVSHSTEIIPFILLTSHTKGNFKRIAKGFSITAGVLFLIIAATVSLSLGSFQGEVLFPFYTLTSIAQTGIFENLNAAYILLWVFISAIKISLYLFCVVESVSKLFKLSKNLSIVISTVAVFLLTLYSTFDVINLSNLHGIILTSLPLLIPAVLMPFVVLIKLKQKRGENNKK